ncbi:MAG: purine-binding chemotaxis protein CheW [Chloroflexi bacterium]|nr:purine-binding chemotaxis protein CheW [Chloroflexota bacterium]
MAERGKDLFAISEVDDIENMYLTFEVQDEEYAVNIAYVVEIVGMQRISEVPDVPKFIKGVINLRGKVIPVMDMRLRFGLPWHEYGERTTIIVMEMDDPSTGSGQAVPTGLVVDRVTDVLTMSPGSIAPPRHWKDDGDDSVVKGLGKRDDGVSIILDVPRLLSSGDVRLDLSSEAGGEVLAMEQAAVIE